MSPLLLGAFVGAGLTMRLIAKIKYLVSILHRNLRQVLKFEKKI